MGALHSGHLSLVTVAQSRADVVIVSIFVNPTQFGPNEDFDNYPRVYEEDIALLEAEAVDIIYMPSVKEIYPNGQEVDVKPNEQLAKDYEGKHRQGHFDGVATVVARLLNHSQADRAVFGEKDFQQLQVIRQMVEELKLSVEIIGAPIARESDGLAMSSRNRYLSKEEREIAPQMRFILGQTAKMFKEGDSNSLAKARQAMLDAGFDSVDYIALVDVSNLEPIERLDREARLLAAATLGKTRLLDNLAVEPIVWMNKKLSPNLKQQKRF